MQYRRISADCHLDMPWMPPDLFVSEARRELKDRMPKERLGLELPKSRVPTSAIAADRINVSVLVRGQTATRLPHTAVAPVWRRAKSCQQPEFFCVICEDPAMIGAEIPV